MSAGWSDLESSDWHDLSQVPDSLDLGMVPAEFWLLHTFYIVLVHRGKHYLVVEYPSYARPSTPPSAEIRECIWSTPYVAYKIETGYAKYSVVGHIRELYERFACEHAEIMEQRMAAKFYHMGISHRAIREAHSILELKRSPREPGKWKCYLAKRFMVWNLDPLGRRNIVDPECLMPYRYLCLTDHASLLEMTDEGRPHHRIFRGKPLSTNLAYLFVKHELALFEEQATAVQDDEFCYREHGLMLSYDLMSFGEFHCVLEQQFRTLEKTGSEIASEFVFGLDGLFRRMLDEHGYYQYHIEGDGFVATCPVRHPPGSEPDVVETTAQLHRTLEMLRRITDEVNRTVASSGVVFGARAALLRADYFFGKTGGLHSESAGHSGKSLITLARMQESSREWSAAAGQKGQLYVFVPPTFYEEHRSVFEERQYEERDRHTARQKETEVAVVVLGAT